MKFQLEFTPKPIPELISLRHPVWLSGSCFASNIATYFQQNRFTVCSNPNGILFNPISILEGLRRACSMQLYTEEDCVYRDGLWHSLHHHGSFSNSSKDELIQTVNSRLKQSSEFLGNSDWIILTFGTGWVYETTDQKKVVANCHKLPAAHFTKRLITQEEILTLFGEVYRLVKKINPGIKFLFSVSPIRYVRDGLVENNRSKAILLESIHKITEQFAHCYYFPAYEIVLDELRDYRFYEADLVHPSKQAIDYVWEKFAATCLDTEAKEFLSAYQSVLVAKSHRRLHKVPGETAKFNKGMVDKIEKLGQRYSFLNFKEDLVYFS